MGDWSISWSHKKDKHEILKDFSGCVQEVPAFRNNGGDSLNEKTDE